MPKQINVTDVNVKKLEIHSSFGKYDLRPHFLELNVYENIFRPALTGTIVLADSHNLPYKLPIMGEETVDIDISLKALDGVKDEERFTIAPPPLHVNSLSDRYFTKPKAQVFSLDLISEKYMSSLHSKVSKSYRGKKISHMVDDIFFNYLYDGTHGIYVEPTERTENLIIPNLSPIDAIKWLSKRAIPNASVGVNYVFYETMNGSKFISLDSLASEEPSLTLFQRPRVDDPTGVSHVSGNEFKIEKFTYVKQFDKIQNTERGVYSSKLITHDIVRKKITQHEYTGFNEWFGFNHCGTFPPLSNSDMETKSSNVYRTSHAPPSPSDGTPTTNERNLARQIDSRVEFYPKHKQMYAKNTGDGYDNRVEDWKLRRNGHMGIYDGISLILELSGNSALRVGHTVSLYLPSPETTDKDKKSDSVDDKFLSGKYMITAIQHIFSNTNNKSPRVEYKMKVEVTKDGLEELPSSRTSRKED